MVQEDVTWFGERGSETLSIPVVVGSGVGPLKPVRATPARADVSEPSPVRIRVVSTATGVREAYWIWRRAVDRVKRVRDAIVVFFKKRLEIHAGSRGG